MASPKVGPTYHFYPTGRTLEELDVGYLVNDPNSPDWTHSCPRYTLPPTVEVTISNPTVLTELNKTTKFHGGLKELLDFEVSGSSGQSKTLQASYVITRRINNVEEYLHQMLGNPETIAWFDDLATAKVHGPWYEKLLKIKVWLVVGVQIFTKTSFSFAETQAKSFEVNATVPVLESLGVTPPIGGVGDPTSVFPLHTDLT